MLTPKSYRIKSINLIENEILGIKRNCKLSFWEDALIRDSRKSDKPSWKAKK